MTTPIYLRRLGITNEHIEACGLPLEEEAIALADGGRDIYDRSVEMTPETLTAWRAMTQAASADGIELQIVSAYRSVEYQCNLIERKLKRGESIDAILKVNAIPGYSEHHTGRALDLTTPEFPPLEEEFEHSAAFSWLCQHAKAFNFHLSYPRDNPTGISYEPWHWAWQPEAL